MDLLVNHYNKYLISADTKGLMCISDFYSGNPLFRTDLPEKILFMR